jgi:two-component system CheB/CheR fusion protein
VRIMPYRTLDDRIDGVVITFTDITTARTRETRLRENQSALEKHVAEQDVLLGRKKKRTDPCPVRPTCESAPCKKK